MPFRLMGFGVLIVGLLVIVFLVFRVVDTFPSPAATGMVGTPLTATLDSEGLTLLADDPSYSMDCEVTNAAGEKIPVSSTDGSTTITINNHTWWVAAKSTKPTPPGEYTVLCDSTDAGLAYGISSGGFGGFVASILGIIGTAFITIIAAIGLFIAGVMKNRRSRQQPNIYTPPPPPGRYPGQPGTYPGQYPNQPPDPGANPYQSYHEY